MTRGPDMTHGMRTTAPVRVVRGIDDIRAIEAMAYDDLVTARNLYDLFLATAATVGDRPALTVLTAPDPACIGLSLTHAALLRQVTRAANMFRALGLAPGQGVAAFLTPTLPLLPVLLWGAQVAGVASSLNYLLSPEAIADLLQSEGATILVIPARAQDAACWDKAQGLLAQVPGLRAVLVIGADGPLPQGFHRIEDLLDPHSDSALDFIPTTDRDTVCALFHTGGTTGRPKLVQLTHGNQIHAAFGFAHVYGYDATDTVINGFPLFHVGGTMTVGLSVVAAGGHMVVPAPYGLRDPQVVARHWELATALGATVVGGVPTSIAALTDGFTPGTDVGRIRMAATGGATLPAAIGARFTDVTGIRLFETYGMTETSAAIAFNPGQGTPRPGSVGLRAPWSQTRVVRLDTGEPCAPGETGLVQVRGRQVFPGYVEPRHNTGTLAPDGWLTTGDLGYLTGDEWLVLTGREKDLIVRSGHNIDPAAIEDVANACPGVRISAAVGMPDQYAGEVPLLFVVPAPGVTLDSAVVEAHLTAHLHEPPARPRGVLVIDALPVTAVGKIFKPALRDMAIQEKLRREVALLGSDVALTGAEITADPQGRLQVAVTLSGATEAQAASLLAALGLLPQSYIVTRESAA
jgi:fatty-acyl-CoA synthase